MEIRQPARAPRHAHAAPAAPDRFLVARLRARVRALEAGLDLQAERVAPALWAVPSVSHAGELHLVRVRRTGLECDCPAAAFGRPCCHVAAVEALRERTTGAVLRRALPSAA